MVTLGGLLVEADFFLQVTLIQIDGKADLRTTFHILDSEDGTHHWIAPVICLGFFLILPLWVYITHHNTFTHDVLYTGWTPVLSAMVISR